MRFFTCSTCIHYQEFSEANGLCRKNPPHAFGITGSGQIKSAFPGVDAKASCSYHLSTLTYFMKYVVLPITVLAGGSYGIFYFLR